MRVKLNAKRSQGPSPQERVTQCPACGYKGIE